MRILYILPSGLMGGMERHVHCLAKSLQGAADCRVLIIGEEGPLGAAMRADGIAVTALGCRNGHDLRIFPRLHRVMREFKPDIVHTQTLILFPSLYFKLFGRKTPYLLSIHMPTKRKGVLAHLLWNWLGRRINYHLPVSSETWKMFRSVYPWAKGEVFFNPVRIETSLKVRKFESLKVNSQTLKPSNFQTFKPSNSPTFAVGMVGRNAEVKDWPSFHKVENLVKGRFEKFLTCEKCEKCERCGVEFLNAGEKEVCDGRAAIARMDLFVMTSKSEELPTVVLECFMLGTPICGFLPVGGIVDILQFSTGPVREAFIAERDCEKLADVVMDLLAHPEKRQALVEDGRQILEGHFDAEKNCKGQLMRVYENCHRKSV